MEFINLTPHQLTIERGSGDHAAPLIIPPSGEVARVSVQWTAAGKVQTDGGMSAVQTWTRTLGEVVGLPEPRDGVVIFIVSGEVASVCRRGDVFSLGEPLLDEEGRPIGYRGLVRSV